MAQILPEEMSSLSNLSPSSKTVYRILEQNLSDEWECHAALSGNNIVRFIITSPDLGVLVLYISNCSPDQFDSFSNDIPQLKQQYLDTVRQHLQKENQLCNDDKSLKFPVGFGLIFTELSSGYANNATIGTPSEFVLFNDELRRMTNSDTELEDRLFDMVEEFDFNELDDELQIISNNIPSIHVALQKVKMEIGEVPEKQIDDQSRLWCSLDKETDEVEEKQIDWKRWWNSLDDEWKNIFMKAIGDHEIYDLPSQVERILNLTKLDCNSSHITNLEPLRKLKSIERLYMSRTQISDLKPLRNLKSLNELNISYNEVSDLKPLRNLKSLKLLNISYNEVSDLEPLRNLKSLKLLYMRHMRVSDLEPLRNLESLNELDISGTQVSEALGITDINSFRKKYPLLDEHSEQQIDQKRWWNSLDDVWKEIFMEAIGDHEIYDLPSQVERILNLTKLDCRPWSSHITDLEPLRNLKSLHKLNISDTQVIGIEPLRNLKSLHKLNISNTQVIGIEPLRNLKNLELLRMSDTRVSDLKPLRNLKSIERLYMGHTQVSDLEPLRNLKNLTTLDMNLAYYVSDLEPLRNLKNLTTLDLSATQVSDLEPLRNLKNLTTLDLSATDVSDLEPLRSLKSLKVLVSDNTPVRKALGITDIYSFRKKYHLLGDENSELQVEQKRWWTSLDDKWKNIFMEHIGPKQLKNLKTLTTLDLSATDVSDLEPLKHLKNLTTLDMAFTDVTDIEPLKHLKNLTTLDISCTDVSDLEPLRNLNKLRTLDSVGTPVSEALGIHDINSFRKKYPLVDENSELQVEQKRWWNSLDDEWKNIFMKHIGDDEIYDLPSQVERILNLTKLVCHFSNITDLKPLRNLKSLTTLNISYTQVSDLKPLKNLKSLKTLDISLTKVSDLEPLRNLKSLKVLFSHNTPVSKALGITDINSFRKKYPIVDEYSEQQSADIIENDGQDMLEDVGVVPFINHLESLGYESRELDLKECDINEDRKCYMCTHQSKRYLILLPLDELGMILFRCPWSVEDPELKYKEIELLQTINELNASNYITCCHLGKSKDAAVIQAVLSNRYSKIEFDLFLEHFLNKTKEFYNTITDRKEYLLVDEYSEQQSADIIKDSGQDMLEDVGVAPFINHLEFLGYKSIEYDINEDQQYYICTHQSKRYLILLPLDELGMILFRYQWSVEDPGLTYKEIELLQTINELNASNHITCCHLVKSKHAVIQAVLSNRYSKIEFDLFLEHFLNKTNEFCKTITEILEDDVPY